MRFTFSSHEALTGVDGVPQKHDILDSAEEPLWQKSDSEKDHLRCIPRPFKSTIDEISA